MSGTTSVPDVSFGPNGFVVPAEADILTGVLADMDAAFGGGMNPALETPQGQLASSQTAIIGDKNDQFLYLANQVDPAFAEGRFQDGIARIYFLDRDPARATVLQVVCTGLTGVNIPVGALVQDSGGYVYSCTQSGTIGIGGAITLSFAGLTTGPIPSTAQTLTIYRAIPGWDTAITVTDGAIGNNVESRSAFEIRRAASVALNAQGSMPSVRAAVLNVSGVLDAYVNQNVTDAPVSIGTVSLLAHSIYVCVLGGAAQDIGEAMWRKVSPGCNYNGDTTVTVQDTSYSAPYPSYTVKFETPTLIAVYVQVTLKSSPSVPSNVDALVDAAIISAFSGEDGGARPRIGGVIYASRFYNPVALLGVWAQIISIKVKKGPGGTFVDSIAMEIDEAPTISATNVTTVLA